MAAGVIVEFTARRMATTLERPPCVRFDNAHAVDENGRGYRRKRTAYDHWHRTATDKGRPYNFTTVIQLLDDCWREVKRTLDEKGIPNDL